MSNLLSREGTGSEKLVGPLVLQVVVADIERRLQQVHGNGILKTLSHFKLHQDLITSESSGGPRTSHGTASSYTVQAES